MGSDFKRIPYKETILTYWRWGYKCVNIMLPRYISGLEIVYTAGYSYTYTLLHFSYLRMLILLRKHTENSQCLCSSGGNPSRHTVMPKDHS